MDAISVRAPATSANLGAGFDICGVALREPFDEFAFVKSDSWAVTNSGKYPAANDSVNSVFAFVWNAMQAEFNLPGSLAIEVFKSVKPRAGMGASACEAASTAFAVNELFSLGLSKEQLVLWAGNGERFAAGELHYDNVSPCVLGGFTITYSTQPLRIKRLNPPEMACLLVISDREKSSTAFARSILPEAVSLKHALFNSVTLAKLLVGFYEGDLATIVSSLDDQIVESARSKAGILPFLTELKELAKTHGFGAAASGAGPTLIAIGERKDEAFESAVREFYDSKGIGTELVWTEPSADGVRKI